MPECEPTCSAFRPARKPAGPFVRDPVYMITDLRIRPPYHSEISTIPLSVSYDIYLLNGNLTLIFCFPYSDGVEELIRLIFGDRRVCIYQLSVVYVRVGYKIVY